MTGHGGNEFLKFQDNEEISAFDVADAFEQMWQKKRYNELLFMVDTCQANTMYSKIYSPNVLATGSSELAENSYSHENDHEIGLAVIDSFTHHVLQFMEGINKTSHASMADLFASYDFNSIKSHAGVRADLFPRDLATARVTDFFGGVAQVELVDSSSSSDVDNTSDRPEPKLEPDDASSTKHEPDFDLREPVDGAATKLQTERRSKEGSMWVAVLLLGTLVGWGAVSGLR